MLGLRTLYGATKSSQIARLYRSAVGAVSLMVTVVPALGVVALWRCIQNVPILVTTN